jgi:hypothetical protein
MSDLGVDAAIILPVLHERGIWILLAHYKSVADGQDPDHYL